jgi:1,4-dihydroxy-2-naphthoate octaprenyltransferase
LAAGLARQILKLARLHFLVPGIMLFALGALFASALGSPLVWDKIVLGYTIFFLAHLSVSFSNDYFDRAGDTRAEPTPLSGGSGVLVEHPELASLSKRIALALLVGSGLTAVLFTAYYGYHPLFLAFSLAGGWLGWFYTAPPLRFAYRGLGEAATVVAAGLVMPGMGYFVVSGGIDVWFLLLSLPLMCYGLFFILTVEMPDVEPDAVAGKRNLLVRRGRRVGALVAFVACASGTALLLALLFSGALRGTIDFGLIVLFSLIPLAASGFFLLRVSDQRERLVSHVKLNFASMMGFLLLMDLSLAATCI